MIEADGRRDLEHGADPGQVQAGDLFSAATNPALGSAARWHGGTSAGLDQFGIGPPGPAMSYSAR